MMPSYARRIARAEHLKSKYPFATEILTYYSRICAAQENLRIALERSVKRAALPGENRLREQLDVDLLMPHARGVLNALARQSPPPLASHIEELLTGSDSRIAALLQNYSDRGATDEADGDSRDRLIGAVCVQPYAELLAARKDTAGQTAGNLCPRCDGRPVVGVLRLEGDGGKRFLLCSFCGTEWEFRRIFCAYCGETREDSLPVFVAEKFPHVRIEACDACRRCLRTVDLTKDGHAIPVVDDLAAIPLALWSEEHGYTRIYDNLLGT